MSIKVMTQVWASSKQKGTKLLILLALADFTNDDGLSWPSIDRLAQKSRCSRRRAQDAIREIAEDGELQIERNAGPKGVHLYRVTPPVGEEKIAPLILAGAKSDGRGAEHSARGVQSNDAKLHPNHKEPLDNRHKKRKRGRVASHPFSAQLFRDITHRHIPLKMHDRVDRAVGSEFFDLLTWGRVIRWWMMSGYNISNYAGMLDVFGQRKADSKPAVIGKFKDDLT